MSSHGAITRTLKPSSERYWKRTAAGAVILLPFVAAQFLFYRDAPLYWILLLTAVPLVLAGVALYFRRAGVFITATHVGKRNLLGTTWTPKADFDRSLLLRDYRPPAEPSRTELYMFAADGRKLVRLFGRFWAEQDLLAVVEESGSKLTVIDDLMKPKDVAALEPTALTWVEEHPYASTGIAFAALLALVALIAFIVVQVEGPLT